MHNNEGILAYNMRTSLLDCVIFQFRHILAAELKAIQKSNPAKFGFGCDHQCIFEVLGQVPCPGLVSLPEHMRGKCKYPKD
jgi:small subunit ribosomal protein S25